MRWDATVIDDDVARAVLDEFYALPDTVAGGFEDVHHRFTRQGLTFTSAGRSCYPLVTVLSAAMVATAAF